MRHDKKKNKMTLYIRRESSKVPPFSSRDSASECFTLLTNLVCFKQLWKRFCSEITTEIGLLAENWKYLLAGIICQVSFFCCCCQFVNDDSCF